MSLIRHIAFIVGGVGAILAMIAIGLSWYVQPWWYHSHYDVYISPSNAKCLPDRMTACEAALTDNNVYRFVAMVVNAILLAVCFAGGAMRGHHRRVIAVVLFLQILALISNLAYIWSTYYLKDHLYVSVGSNVDLLARAKHASLSTGAHWAIAMGVVTTGIVIFQLSMQTMYSNRGFIDQSCVKMKDRGNKTSSLASWRHKW